MTTLQSQADNLPAFKVFEPPAFKLQPRNAFTPRKHELDGPSLAFIVKNTFVEVQQENNFDASDDESSTCQSSLRRRRGSSLWRSASEPRAPHKESPKMVPSSVLLSDSRKNPTGNCCLQISGYWTSHLNNQPQVCAAPLQQGQINEAVCDVGDPGANQSMSWVYQSPKPTDDAFPNNDANTLADATQAAMLVGFNAGLMAAMSTTQVVQDPVLRSSSQHRPIFGHESVGHVANHHHGGRESATQNLPHRGQPAQRLDVRPGNLQWHSLQSKLQEANFQEYHSSNDSDVSTAVSNSPSSLHEVRISSPSPPRAVCHLIWCDQRAFKEVSGLWKELLESATQLQVKAHKTAEKCIRLLRRKLNSQVRPQCVFLVSWANAPTLLPFLTESRRIIAKVILLCDTDMCRGRGREAAESMASSYPIVVNLAACWADAVVVATHLVGGFDV